MDTKNDAKDKNDAVTVMPANFAPLGGNTAIEPIVGALGAITGYNLVLFNESDGNIFRKQRLSVEHGERIIADRVQLMLSKANLDENVQEETNQTLIPAYVARAYQSKLKELGFPDENIPKDVQGIIALAKQDLESFLKLGQAQSALAAQAIQDELYSVTLEVFRGNRTRFENYPAEFKKAVIFLLPAITAMAAEKAGFTSATLETQKQLLSMNLMAQERTRAVIMDHIAAGGETAGLVIANFLGTSFGGLVASFKKAKEGRREDF